MTDVEARMAIERIIADEDAAWNSGDASGFSVHVADDVIFTNVVGMFSIGRTPFEHQHERIFSTFYKGSRLEQTIIHVALIRPDVAIVDTLTEMTGFQAPPPGAQPVDGVLRTRLEQVMTRDAQGRWSVRSFHNVAIDPAADGLPRA